MTFVITIPVPRNPGFADVNDKRMNLTSLIPSRNIDT